MTFAGIIEIVKGVLAFPDQILKLIQVLKKTPQEKHDELLAKIASEAKQFEDTGRPTA